ncbi:putative ATP grasp protein [Citrobacter phage CVT22]|uniref:ATP grasp protein n=1 Tax=Citrobacter phage CVT22 TaxID=1622234 RepID=A0A0R5ZWQ5_9CAUD|nr:ribosomal protein S6 glutaminyl transferase [Citrobacter phage CVT22]AJT60754.1 putative ATP grasp protein [Citrobacter phage CVT22]
MKAYIYPYNKGSQSAKLLSEALNVKRLKLVGSKYKGNQLHTIINWGSSTLPDAVKKGFVLNSENAIINSSNKLKSFELFKENNVSIPPFFTTREEAEEAIQQGACIVCRTILSGHSGAGIVIADNVDELVKAPLYVTYIPKKHEYRYHVFMGKVIDVQRKARNKDVADEDVNWKVRNHDNGFIFMREGVVADERASEQAILAVQSLGLDFGAVDIIWNEKQDKYFVLEVNSAPGLTGTTLDNYVAAFKDVL